MRAALIMILFLSCSIAFGQISTMEEPMSFRMDIPILARANVPVKYLPPLDMQRIMQEDIENEGLGPLRFGYKFRVNYNLENSGEWFTLPDGGRIWRLSLSSQGALSINLLYDKFWLPDGAKLWIYSNVYRHSIGAFTSFSNTGGRHNIQGFSTDLVFGDQITLEYYVPNGVSDVGVISIAYVVHGYRYVLNPFTVERTAVPSNWCQVNVSCPEGANWQNEKNAVAQIQMGGEWCTGFLINNTANNGRLLFMTAYHCLPSWDNLTHSWIFSWNFESPDCETTIPWHRHTTRGATILARNSNSDFALLELHQDPRLLLGRGVIALPYFLGWDRSGNPGTGGVGIHHPLGDVKRISTYTITPQRTNWRSNTVNPNGTHWRVTWAQGVTAGGSSGSPLINSNRRVIGQLHGGTSHCDPTPIPGWGTGNRNTPDWYGRFNVSWTGGGTNSTRLSNWLDPLGTNAMSIAGMPAIPFIMSGPDVVCCDGSEFALHNLPQGVTVAWSITGPFSIYPTTGTSTTVTRIGTGNERGFLDARIEDSLNHQLNVRIRKTITPCPAETVYFTNRTVNVNETVTDCGGGDIVVRDVIVINGATLTVIARSDVHLRNITVQNGAKLIIEADGEVFFDGDFYIQLGSQFEMR